MPPSVASTTRQSSHSSRTRRRAGSANIQCPPAVSFALTRSIELRVPKGLAQRAQQKGFDLPPAHAAFYRGLRLVHQEGDYLFVHAGLGPRGLQSGDPAYALRVSRPEDLLWTRSTADLPHTLGLTVIYGHTPSRDFSVRRNEPFSIGIDTGAVYGGPLSAIRLPDETIVQTV